jgi:tRNA uridine 5-carboxymethylaminomethyl modification enzyme
MGRKTLLVTGRISAIGETPCNPSIGGLAKGQLVRELDALGGQQALATDAAGIHFRMLNTGRGAAVRAPRAQVDKGLYRDHCQRVCNSQPGLEVVEGLVVDLLAEGRALCGARLASGQEISCCSAVLSPGTFLRGRMHTGGVISSGGQKGQNASEDLSAGLERLGFNLGRMKTGTSPRVAASSIDTSQMRRQDADNPARPFSFKTSWQGFSPPAVPCYVTHTNRETCMYLRNNLKQFPLYNGQITGVGPRYCPSIETKALEFSDRDNHQVFIEPQGLNSDDVYIGGLATSIPEEMQIVVLRTIPGLQEARVLKFGYAVEYDYVPAQQFSVTLESRSLPGLFLAGQVNGTSGYEEAAAQGWLAGVNAALSASGEKLLVMPRHQSFLGVMVDDLVSRRPLEPYRLFTSRSEFRQVLRHDNADRRLGHYPRQLGISGADRLDEIEKKSQAITQAVEFIHQALRDGRPLSRFLRRPEVNLEQLLQEYPLLADILNEPEVVESVEIEIKYEPYIKRAQEAARRVAFSSERRLNSELDYDRVPGLSNEARAELRRVTPATLGQAGRLAGVTPADVVVLEIWLDRICSSAQVPVGKGSQ